jgi:hypothetical protein
VNCLDKLAKFFRNSPDMKTSIPPVLITFVLVCIGLLPQARAVTPPPDGGYPGQNTAEGDNALLNLTTGTDNTAIGFDALRRDTTGSQNTALGSQALSTNGRNSGNTAIGFQALLNNLGFQNTATGAHALLLNIHGADNTANGFNALLSNRNGRDNTAIGHSALQSNVDGDYNTANGAGTMIYNTSGLRNTANGAFTMWFNTTGSANTADGYNALFNNTTGSANIALGHRAGFYLTTGSHNIDIGNDGRADESGRIRIGTPNLQTATFIAGIRDVTVAAGVSVVVSPNGQLGTLTSSVRFKEAIEPMDKASAAILALKPVSFHYKKELDPDAVPQFGLVAEDVEKVDPDLVVRDKEGKLYTVRYDAVNVMLLNEFLKEHKKVEQQDRKLEQQEATIAKQQKQIEALAAGLQKVSAQVEMSRPAPQMVVNEQ